MNITPSKFYSQGIVRRAETASATTSRVKATHAAVGGIDNLVKKVAKSADPTQVAEAKGTLSAQEASRSATPRFQDSDSDED